MVQTIDQPKVSIGIPTFNRAQTLPKTIEAMLSQTFSDFELIICDDASTDETAEIVARYRDHRIKYFRNSINLGIYKNLNRCIELARGEYVAIYHDHDDYLSTILEESVRVLEAYPNVGFVHTAICSKNSQGEIMNTFVKNLPAIIPGREFAEKIAHRWDSLVCGAAAMVRRSLYKQVGYYDPQFGAGSDIDMWVRLALIADVGYVAKPLAILSIRQSGDMYAGFDWSCLCKHFRLLERNLQRVYGNAPRRLAWHQRKYAFSRDLKLMEMFCRDIVKSEVSNHHEGLTVMQQEGSSWVQQAGKILSQYPNFFRNILSLALGVYRMGWKLRIKAEQLRAKHILEQNMMK